MAEDDLPPRLDKLRKRIGDIDKAYDAMKAEGKLGDTGLDKIIEDLEFETSEDIAKRTPQLSVDEAIKLREEAVRTAPKLKDGSEKIELFRGERLKASESAKALTGSYFGDPHGDKGQWFTNNLDKAKQYALADDAPTPTSQIKSMTVNAQELLDGYIRSFLQHDINNPYSGLIAQDDPDFRPTVPAKYYAERIETIKKRMVDLVDMVDSGKKSITEVASLLGEGVFPFASDRAKMNFIQTFKMNPRLALVTVAKGVGKHALMGLAEGVLYAPAMAAIMPVPANRDEQALLDSMDRRGGDEFINAYLGNNMNKEFVQRIVNYEQAPPPLREDGQLQTHLMSAEFLGKNDTIPAVFPQIVNEDGVLKRLSPEDARKFALENGEYIEFGNIDDAIRFSQNYKGARNSAFNEFYRADGLYQQHFGREIDGINIEYMNNYLSAIHNEFDGTYRDTNTYTNDNVSPEALMTMGAFLDRYFETDDGLSVNVGVAMGAPDYSDLYSMRATKTENSYVITDALDDKQTDDNFNFVRSITMNNPNAPEGTFNNYFADDSYQIDIEIPNFIEAEPFTLDAEPLIIDGRPKFDTGALSRERQRHMGAMLEAIRGVGKE